jgi:hypothetical protein
MFGSGLIKFIGLNKFHFDLNQTQNLNLINPKNPKGKYQKIIFNQAVLLA